MNRLLLSLEDISEQDRNLVGGKAVALAQLARLGILVPGGFCLTKIAYQTFLKETDLNLQLAMELGRKRFQDMRWEELWDAALRIRNLFTRTAMPTPLEQTLLAQIESQLSGQPLAIRSSALAEDGQQASFAGIHESFVNVSKPTRVLQSVKLVWASLWSDAALLYQDELALEIETSAMAVIIQPVVFGDRSGVVFTVDPNYDRQLVIESVYGMNKGLVDGDVEPDRYHLDRQSGQLISTEISRHERQAIPANEGITITTHPARSEATLDEKRCQLIYQQALQIEAAFGCPQDIEWTIKDEELIVLQSRPITTLKEDKKSWYLSLRRTLDNLQNLAIKIEHEILPQMEAEAAAEKKIELTGLSDEALAQVISRRDQQYQKWHDVYWEECIPFAHGVRLFGMVYNDQLQPEDPFEFIGLLKPHAMLGLQRNQSIETIIRQIKQHPGAITSDYRINHQELDQAINDFIEQLAEVTGDQTLSAVNKTEIVKFLQTMAQGDNWRQQVQSQQLAEKTVAFFAAFSQDEQSHAKQLLDVARKSYQLRDDDNIYLGKIQANLTSALLESQQRLGRRCQQAVACSNPEEVITALKMKDYQPTASPTLTTEATDDLIRVRARQLRGQPAAPGVVRGPARLIRTTADLLQVKPKDILVCDAIDPTMTFVVPTLGGIIERRGGMLIHGAIIAREYGLPCVTGIPEATELIRNGDEVTVDGFTGLVINHSHTDY